MNKIPGILLDMAVVCKATIYSRFATAAIRIEISEKSHFGYTSKLNIIRMHARVTLHNLTCILNANIRIHMMHMTCGMRQHTQSVG